jgi:diaminohydroxyphosphoribosylaminopyrimidine deaminase / 5-amino-6-(5-phosphoribosylamino)uracil reductase
MRRRVNCAVDRFALLILKSIDEGCLDVGCGRPSSHAIVAAGSACAYLCEQRRLTMRESPGPRSSLALIDAGLAWSFVCEIQRAVRHNRSLPLQFGLASVSGGAAISDVGDPRALLTINTDGSWTSQAQISDEVASILDLYLPVSLSCEARPLVVAHLGISLDGQVATRTGASHYITGPENIVHLHRLRALVDAVVVGAGTVEHDDPQLTTRHVKGRNPVRVVIDPSRRLRQDLRVFSDKAADTLLVCMAGCATLRGSRHGKAGVLEIAAGPNGHLSLHDLLVRLRAVGLHSILVEGGGNTVSRFLSEGKLDRLQLAFAPIIMGSGRPALVLPGVDRIADALRPRCRHFRMGQDMLFDCDLRADGPQLPHR